MNQQEYEHYRKVEERYAEVMKKLEAVFDEDGDGLLLFEVCGEADRREVGMDALIRQFVKEGLERAEKESWAGKYEAPRRTTRKQPVQRSALGEYIFGTIEQGIEKFMRQQGIN